jgi:hypothetical protein
MIAVLCAGLSVFILLAGDWMLHAVMTELHGMLPHSAPNIP